MKKWVELFKELRKTSKGKAILFFGGYLIFFVIVILFVRLSSKDMTNPDDYQKGNSSDINIDLLLNNNYLFTYNVVLDNKEYIYYGKRNNDVELFSIGDKTYYKNGDSYFTKNNDLWVKTENPYLFSLFLDSNKINSILEDAYMDSTTDFEDGRKSINMLISTNTINQKFNNIESDYFEEPNTLTIIANKDKVVDEITYDLSSYCTLNKLCQSSLKIKLNYEMFGEIKDIENPVNE